MFRIIVCILVGYLEVFHALMFLIDAQYQFRNNGQIGIPSSSHIRNCSNIRLRDLNWNLIIMELYRSLILFFRSSCHLNFVWDRLWGWYHYSMIVAWHLKLLKPISVLGGDWQLLMTSHLLPWDVSSHLERSNFLFLHLENLYKFFFHRLGYNWSSFARQVRRNEKHIHTH